MPNIEKTLSPEDQLSLNAKLLKMLEEELTNRLKYYADQWRRKSIFRRFASNPFLSLLNSLKSAKKDASTKEQQTTMAKAILDCARQLESECDKVLPQLSLGDSLSKSIETICLAEGILLKVENSSPVEAVSNPLHGSNTQPQAICSDAVVQACYDDLRSAAYKHEEKNTLIAQRRRRLKDSEVGLKLGAIPGYSDMNSEQRQRYEPLYLQAENRNLLQEGALPLIITPEDSDQSFSQRPSVTGDIILQPYKGNQNKLQEVIRGHLGSLYMDAYLPGVPVSEQALLDAVDNKTYSIWNFGFGSNEFKTVKSLLQEAKKNVPDRVAIERRLRRLEKKTTARALVSQPLTAERLPTTREKVLRLYECDLNGTDDTALFKKVEKITAGWANFGMDSSELKTVKSLLAEAEKTNKDDKVVARRLERLIKLVQARVAKEKKNSWKVVQNLEAPVSVSAPATLSEVKPIDAIRVEFAKARYAADVEELAAITLGERKDTLGLIARERVIQQYELAQKSVTTNDFQVSAIDSERLPADVHDLQALVYFIFKQNDAENPPRFPISWSANESLKITRDGDFASLLNPPAKLDEALFTPESRSFYFAVLMISIALMGASQTSTNRNEYIGLRGILSTLLNNNSGVAINAAIRELPSNFQWLSNYMPDEISPPDNSEILANVRVALLGEDHNEGMFPPVIDAPQLKKIAAPVLKVKEFLDVNDIDRLNIADLRLRTKNYAEEVAGKALTKEEQEFLDLCFTDDLRKYGNKLSNKSILLHVILSWYTDQHVGDQGDAGEFIDRCFVLKNAIANAATNEGEEINISLTNKRNPPAVSAKASEFKSDHDLSQNLYRKGMLQYRETSADRLVDIVYNLFQDRTIKISPAKTFTTVEKKYISDVVFSAKSIRIRPSIQYLVEYNLRIYSNANPKTLAAYTLCQWYKLTKGGQKNIKNAEFLQQYERMEDRLLSALEHSESVYPDDQIKGFIKILKEKYSELLTSRDGMLGKKASSFSLLLDHLEAMPTSDYQLPVRAAVTEEMSPQELLGSASASASASESLSRGRVYRDSEKYKTGDEPTQNRVGSASPVQEPAVAVLSAQAVNRNESTVDQRPWWETESVVEMKEALMSSVKGLAWQQVQDVISDLPDPGDNPMHRKLTAIYCLVSAQYGISKDEWLIEYAHKLLNYIRHPLDRDIPVLVLTPFAQLKEEDIASLKTLDFTFLGSELSNKINTATQQTEFTIEEVEKIYTQTNSPVQDKYSVEKSAANDVKDGYYQGRARFAWLVGNYESVGMFARMICNWQAGYVSDEKLASLPWLNVEPNSLSKLLTFYANSHQDSDVRKEYKMQIDAVCGSDAREKLRATLLQFHASWWRSGGDANLANDKHKLPTQMEAIVKKLNNTKIPLAQILLDLRAAAHERKDATCSSRFFVGRRSETSRGYACIHDYLNNQNGKKIESNQDWKAFISALTSCAPQSKNQATPH